MAIGAENKIHREFSTRLSSGVLGRAKSGKTTLLLLGAIELVWLKPRTNIFFVSSGESPEQLMDRAKAYGKAVPPNLAFHASPKEGRLVVPPTDTTLIVLD